MASADRGREYGFRRGHVRVLRRRSCRDIAVVRVLYGQQASWNLSRVFDDFRFQRMDVEFTVVALCSNASRDLVQFRFTTPEKGADRFHRVNARPERRHYLPSVGWRRNG